MNKIEVPDFVTLNDFKNWAGNLDDKEIQSWTTKDWLALYEKIDAYVDGPDFDQVYRDRLPRLIEENVFTGTVESLTNNPSVNSLKRRAFIASDETVRNIMGNLYCNYRFESKQLKTIRKLGAEAGQKMAKQQGVDLASLAIKTENGNFSNLINVMSTANDITINQTNYKNLSHKSYKDWFSFKIDDEIENIGQATIDANGRNILVINSQKVADNGVHTAFHEGAHLHMQNKIPGQRILLSNFDMPAVEDLGYDFQKLMEKNMDYYIPLRSSEATNELYQRFLSVFDEKEVKRLMKMDYNRYHKQPVEKFSEIYGIEAERALRRETHQLSERTAMQIADKIESISGMSDLPEVNVSSYIGRPSRVQYVENAIELTYGSYDTEPEKLAEKIRQKFSNADESLLEDLNIRVDKTSGEVRLTVPNNYDFTSRYQKFAATPSSSSMSASKSVMSSSEKAATKSVMKAAATKAKAKIKIATKTAGKTTKETLLAVNKAYDDAFDALVKWGDKHSPQWMNKVEEATVQKAAEKFMQTKSGKAIAKQIEKKIGKEVAASAAKKIPLLCLVVGAYCVCDRIKDKEYVKAVGEGASAIVSNFPGLGTLASFGIDGMMLSDDLGLFEHGIMQRDLDSHMVAESTFIPQPIDPQEKFVRRLDEAVEKRNLGQALQVKVAAYGKKSVRFDTNSGR